MRQKGVFQSSECHSIHFDTPETRHQNNKTLPKRTFNTTLIKYIFPLPLLSPTDIIIITHESYRHYDLLFSGSSTLFG